MAEDVGKGVVSIEADTKGLGKDIGDKIGKESGGLSKIFSSIGHTAGAAFKAAAVAGVAGIAAGAAFAKGAVDAASDLSESMSKVNVVFGDASKDVVAWSETSAKAFGQSQQSALEAAGTYGNLFQAFGIAQKPAQEMSQTLVELAADLASFNNTSVEDALQALQSGVSGETEPLKRYGVAINDVRLKQKALELGLISSTKDALTPAAKAQASYALILQDTTLAQGDFERTSDGLANQQRILAAQWTDMKAKVGKFLLPAFAAIVSFLSGSLLPALPKVAKSLAALFGDDGAQQFAEGLDGVFGNTGKLIPVLRTVGFVVLDVVNALKVAGKAVVGFLVDNWGTIKAVAAGIVAAAQQAFAAIATTVMWVIDHKPVLIGVLTGIGAAVVALFATWAIGAASAAAATLAAAAPFIAIGVAVAAVTAAVIYAYQNWDWFRTTVQAVASFFTDTFWPILQTVFGWLRDNVPPIIQAIAGWITESFVPTLQAIYQWIADYVFPVVQKLAEFFVAYWTVAFQLAKTAVETIITVVTTLWGWMQTLWDRSEGLRAFLAGAFTVGVGVAAAAFIAVKNALLGVYEWLKTMWDRSESVRSFFADAFTTGINVAKDAIIGVKNALLGVWEWLQSAWDKAVEVAGYFEGGFSTAIGVAKAAWDGIYTAISYIVGGLKTLVEWAGKAIEKLKEVGKNAAGAALGPVGQLIPGFADGGSFMANQPMIVGERGWELLVPRTSGYVIPHEESVALMSGAGKGGPTVSIDTANFYDAVDLDGFARVLNMQLATG